MEDKGNEFQVSFNTNINSVNGAHGYINLNASSQPFRLDAVKMAKLIVKVEQFYAELKEEMGD